MAFAVPVADPSFGLDPDEATWRQMAARVGSASYERWNEQMLRTGACSHPIRLKGRVERAGEVIFDTATEPDRVLLKACGSRSPAKCPSCAHTYQGDQYQLIYAGIAGGRKGVPETVADHPMAFVTLTAPSFGSVHGTREGAPCLPRRHKTFCPHGRPTYCVARHRRGDELVGQALCPDCYDYRAAVAFNWRARELWRRFTEYLPRRLAGQLGLTQTELRKAVRVSFVDVVEFQHRGVIHFHALIRLDDRNDLADPPPFEVTPKQLERAVRTAADQVRAVVDIGEPELLELRFGAQVDVRRLYGNGTAPVTPEIIASCIAKYTTKGCEDLGLGVHPVTPAMAAAQGANPHIVRMVTAAHDLAATVAGLERLAAKTHHLGFAGHYCTKSRRYSTTMGALRCARANHQRRLDRERRGLPADEEDGQIDDDAVATWTYSGRGYSSTGDAILAASAAARAREWRQLAREDQGRSRAAQ